MKKLVKFLSLGLLLSSTLGCIPVAMVATQEVGTSIVEERSFGAIVDDAAIMTQIKNKYAQRDASNMFSRISVHVKEGRVLLTGSLPNHDIVIEAVKIAWSVEGVKEVINELEVADKDLKIRARDALIATQIRAKFLLQKGLSSVDYTVDVNNCVVYLIGIAQNQNELDIASKIASEVKGVNRVINHVTLKDDPRRKR